MGVPLRVEALCPVAEVDAAYRRERDAVRRSHLQVIWLLLDGMASPEVARVDEHRLGFARKLLKIAARITICATGAGMVER